MKKLFTLILILPLFLLGCKDESKNETGSLSEDHVYFLFAKTCPHCHAAMEYINQKYPDLDITMIDVNTPQGSETLWQTASKYNLGDYVGVPLIVMGKNHIMGWTESYEARFDEFVKPFVK